MLHARPDYARIQDPANKIPDNEPVFLLRAQDITAEGTLRSWIELNEKFPNHAKEAVRRAKAHLLLFQKWPIKKMADVQHA